MGKDDDDDQKFGIRRRIMLTAVCSSLAIGIFIILLHLYSRYLMRRQERRRQAILNRLTHFAHDEVNSTEPPKSGLDPLVIASLPTITYKLTNQHDHGEPIECSVCLSTIVEDAKVRQLPDCKHMFHVECIDMWLGSHTTCPMCRMVPEPKVQTEDKELGTGSVQPTAPPIEEMEKADGSGSRLGSFQRMLSRERSSRRIQSCGDEVEGGDLERQ